MAYFFILMFVSLGAVMRLVPHLPNFAPIAAIALFGGVYLGRKWAIILPLSALLISDLFIGIYTWQIMLSVYLSFALIGLIGIWVKKRKNFPVVLGATLSGSVLFFIVTNFAVWAFSTMYPLTLQGLSACYIAAIPFFRHTLLGDLFYVGLFFGSYELATLMLKKRASVPKEV